MELPPGREHVIDKNLSLLSPLGIEATGLREFPLPYSEEITARVAGGLRDLSVEDFVILNPAGGWASKLWPAEMFGELARGLLYCRIWETPTQWALYGPSPQWAPAPSRTPSLEDGG